MPRNPLNPRLSNGDRIREVCEITERLGKATSPMVRARMVGPQTTSNAAKYCSRALIRVCPIEKACKVSKRDL